MAEVLLVGRSVPVFPFVFGGNRVDFVFEKFDFFLVEVVEKQLVIFGVLRLAVVVMALRNVLASHLSDFI